MSKKQKMKMLAAGSLYINNGTALAETEPPPMESGFTDGSTNNDVTIVIAQDRKPYFNEETNKWEEILIASDENKIPDYDEYKYGHDIQFGLASVSQKGQDSKIKVHAFEKYVWEEGPNGQKIPVAVYSDYYLDTGSRVKVSSTNEKGIIDKLTVNDEEYDINTIKFNNSGFVGDTQNKGGWTVTDKTTGKVYKDTTLDRVETSKTKGDYGINYDTAGNKVELTGVASADKLEDVDNSAVKYDPIYDKQGNIIGYDYSKITLGGDTYINKRGGTELTNVAYAGNIRDENGKVLGSAAVNVDYLNDQLDIAKAEVTKNDQHLNYNKDYAVDRDKNEVKLEVVDNQGNLVGECENCTGNIWKNTELWKPY